METVEICIKNWEKFNPRSDRKKHSWFRLEVDWYDNESLFGLSWQQKSLWPVLLAIYANKYSAGFVTINVSYIADKVKLPIDKIFLAIESFADKGVIEIRKGAVTSGNRATPQNTEPHTTNVRTNVRDVTNNNAQNSPAPLGAVFDLEALYRIYPRKQGKQKGMTKLASVVKNQERYGQVKIAIERYKAHCEAKSIEGQFVKYFSSFMSEWQDWLDPETGKTEDFSKAPNPDEWLELYNRDQAAS
jgi:hypothetical protein